MSQQSILEKSLQIRNETQEYANTRGRVADVLDDINETKANRTEVTEEIDEAIEALNIGSKMDRPTWDGSVKYYLVKSDAGANNLQEMTLSANRVPVWSGNNLVDSPVYVSPGRIGIGAASVSEVLEVAGNVKANALILPANGSSAIANRLRSDGTSVYYANSSSVEKRLAYTDEIVLSDLKYGNFNPPTLAQLTALGIKRGDFYVQTSNGTSAGTEVQRSLFDGVQLIEWTVITSVWNGLSAAQKSAVKNFNVV